MSNKAICRPKDKRKDEILRGYEYQIELVRSLENEVNVLVAGATKMTSIITDMPRGGSSLDMGDWVAKWEPLQLQIKSEIEEAVKIRLQIREYLDQVKIPKLRTVLQLTYIECLSQGEIADRMDYSVKQVYNLTNKALDLIKLA